MPGASKKQEIIRMLDMLSCGRVTPAQVDRVAKGINLDQLRDDGRSLLERMILYGYDKAIHYLIDKGANLNRKGRFGGTAFTWAIGCQSLDAAAKLKIVERMLEARVNLNAMVEASDPKDAFRSGTVAEYVIDQATKELKVANNPSSYIDSRRDAKSQVAVYRKVLVLLLGKNPTLSKCAQKQLQALVGRSSVPPKKSARFAPHKARALIKLGDRSSIYDACQLLAGEIAVAHSQWSNLVRAAINASRTFEDVSREVYGAIGRAHV